MANQPIDVVILKDAAGDYYVLPREGLERAKVPPDQKEEVQKLVQQGSAGGELSDEQLESVTGGTFAVGSFSVNSRLVTRQFDTWDNQPDLT